VARESLGLLGYDSFHFAVERSDRSRDFYVNKLDFREVARSGEVLTARSGQESTVVAAGDVRVVISHPQAPTSKAARFLRRHPCGVMSLSFRVRDVDRAFAYLDKRGATFLTDVLTDTAGGGTYRAFEIATPLGDLNYRFIERNDYPLFAPGFENVPHAAGPNEFGIAAIDHVTSNMRTMAPFILWLQHVLGMERYWEVAFHTEDVQAGREKGSGLKSIVMWDPESGVKFANNEPLRPYFNDSQIAKFVEDNAGAGVQHAALLLPDLVDVVTRLRARGVEFLSTPGAYYDQLPARLRAARVGNLSEPIDALRALEILVDGRDDKYMLQIFLKEAAELYHESKAGPFFFELIQRAGHPGFGEGNFRALFEAIERQQQGAGAGA
jgi:4-hydroxyphenylpyruvate dioxygenase